jgi:hypothetical protein
MAKGSEAKDKVFAALAEAFGSDWIGVVDRKGYVMVKEGGEKLQIAVSLTVPKNPVGVVNTTSSGGFDFSDEAPVIAPTKFEPAEITQEEKDNIASMMARLGL